VQALLAEDAQGSRRDDTPTERDIDQTTERETKA
jgi:hypothetical protein